MSWVLRLSGDTATALEYDSSGPGVAGAADLAAGAGAGAIVVPIAGAFVLVLGACATDRPLACAVLAYIDGLLGC